MIYNGTVLKKDSKNQVEIEVPIEGQYQEFNLTMIRPDGNVAVQSYSLSFKDWGEFLRTLSLEKELPKRVSVSAAAGTTFTSYRQLGVSNIDQTLLNLKLSGLYRLGTSRRIDLGVMGYYHPWIFYSSQTASIRFLGINLRAGYQFMPHTSRWRLILNLDNV